MASLIDTLLVGAGLVALACVMLFMARRPGRRRRVEMEALLSRSTDAARPTLPEHCVFISYRRADSGDIVGRLSEHLGAKLGEHAVFKDVDSLRAGDDFRAQLDASIKACLVLLCVMGERWVGPPGAPARLIDNPEDYVRIEVETALQRNIPVIPVFVGAMRMPTADFFPASLKALAFQHGLPLRPDPDFRTDAARLIAGIVEQLEKQLGASRSA
jgi:hypothetical protein